MVQVHLCADNLLKEFCGHKIGDLGLPELSIALLEQDAGAGEITMNDGLRFDAVQEEEGIGYVHTNTRNLVVFQHSHIHNSPEVGRHQLCEDYGITLHHGANECKDIWMSYLGHHVQVVLEELAVILGDNLAVDAAGSHLSPLIISHLYNSPPSPPHLFQSELDLAAGDHPRRCLPNFWHVTSIFDLIQ